MPQADDEVDRSELEERSAARWITVEWLAGCYDLMNRRRLFVGVAAPLLVVYLLTASWWEFESGDSFANALAARTIAVDGTVQLDSSPDLVELDAPGRWIAETPDGGHVVKYPVGAALHAVPFYWVAPGTPETIVVVPFDQGVTRPARPVSFPPVWPAALASALCAAVAMGFLALTFRELTYGSTAAMAAAIAGLATSVWSVAADELWQHTGDLLWLAVAGYALARGRVLPAAVAYCVAVVVRPLTGVIPAGAVFLLGLRRRFGSAALLVMAVVAGAALVVAYNAAVFGELSVSGGYGVDAGSMAADKSPAWVVGNVAQGLFHPRYGTLIWSPFLVVLFVGVRKAWQVAPDWVRGPALGSLGYLAFQWVLNRASGGSGYFFYRYTLEPLVATAPLLLIAYLRWVRPRPAWTRAMWVLIVPSVVAHLIAALAFR